MTTALIVDDQEANLYYLRSLLQASGWQVETARDGAEALARAKASPPDLVVSDLLMPVMDGYTLLSKCRADPRLRQVPFVVYTATYRDPEDERLAMGLGADAFILKPTEPDVLVARLREVEGRRGERPATGEQAPAGPESLSQQYSQALIRKLEQRSLQLEETNRKLEADIAERREVERALRESAARLQSTEEQLRQAQKLEALGRLAGGVAHDFNNLLTVILSYTDLVLGELAPGSPLAEDLVEVRRASERATGLTRQLLTFSRRQVLHPTVVDLGAVVLDMETLLRRLLREDLSLSLRTPGQVAPVHADQSQLEQLLLNLALNARDAMPNGGKLTIEVSLVERDDDRPGLAPGRYVLLQVTDTGNGMDAATKERIFEPFFTTKEPGQGTGLGLATVFGIVSQSGGHVDVESAPGKGAVFKVYLPYTERPLVQPRVTPLPTGVRGTETILLVEDDEQVRAVNRAILERNGYRVIDVANGADALAACARFSEKIDLLVTDVVMPGMSGRALAERLASLRPALKVLYLSGYTDDAVVHHGVLNEHMAFLQKPTTPEVLLLKLREVLGEDARGG